MLRKFNYGTSIYVFQLLAQMTLMHKDLMKILHRDFMRLWRIDEDWWRLDKV